MAEEFVWNIDWDEVPKEAEARPRPADPSWASGASPSTPPPAAPPAAPPLAQSKAPPAPSPAPSGPAPAAAPAAAPVAAPKALLRGQRLDLAALGCGGLVLYLALKLASASFKVCSLGLLEDNRFVADDYFVFEGQSATPCGACTLVGGGLRFDLTRAPAKVHRFLVAVYTEAELGVNAHGPGVLQVHETAGVCAEAPVAAADLGSAKCALVAEIYRRGSGWRFGVLLATSGGTLEALLRTHGAEVT